MNWIQFKHDVFYCEIQFFLIIVLCPDSGFERFYGKIFVEKKENIRNPRLGFLK